MTASAASLDSASSSSTGAPRSRTARAWRSAGSSSTMTATVAQLEGTSSLCWNPLALEDPRWEEGIYPKRPHRSPRRSRGPAPVRCTYGVRRARPLDSFAPGRRRPPRTPTCSSIKEPMPEGEFGRSLAAPGALAQSRSRSEPLLRRRTPQAGATDFPPYPPFRIHRALVPPERSAPAPLLTVGRTMNSLRACSIRSSPAPFAALVLDRDPTFHLGGGGSLRASRVHPLFRGRRVRGQS